MDYKDLKAGTYAKEASEYALAGEVGGPTSSIRP